MICALVCAGSKQKMVLNSSDKLFAELRDMDFPTAAARVNRDLKRLKDGYDRSKASDQPKLAIVGCQQLSAISSCQCCSDVRPLRPCAHQGGTHTAHPKLCLCVQDKSASVSQIKNFTGELKAHYAHLERHALVVELITKRSPGLGIQSRMRAEQQLLDSFGLDTVCETIEVRPNDSTARNKSRRHQRGTSSVLPDGPSTSLLLCVYLGYTHAISPFGMYQVLIDQEMATC